MSEARLSLGPAEARMIRARRERPLPPGFGLLAALAVSLCLWAGLATLAAWLA